MSTQALADGTVFANRYRIVRCLARGGMGAVYEVVHLDTNRKRALKAMHAHILHSDELRQRFHREARVAAEVESDFIVDVFDTGVDDATGMPFLCMELLRGEELSRRVKRLGRIPRDELALYLHQTALALDKTHQAGIIHRDLKPENLFITDREDGPPRIKVLDFGIAKVIEDGATSGPATLSMGTPLYMSPEQFSPKAGLTSASDVYALGMIAYTCLVGMPYWEDESRIGNIFAFGAVAGRGPLEAASVRALKHGVTLPPGFDEWFNTVTSVDPEQRFAPATAATRALGEILGVALGAAPLRAPIPSQLTVTREASTIGFNTANLDRTGSLPQFARESIGDSSLTLPRLFEDDENDETLVYASQDADDSLKASHEAAKQALRALGIDPKPSAPSRAAAPSPAASQAEAPREEEPSNPDSDSGPTLAMSSGPFGDDADPESIPTLAQPQPQLPPQPPARSAPAASSPKPPPSSSGGRPPSAVATLQGPFPFVGALPPAPEATPPRAAKDEGAEPTTQNMMSPYLAQQAAQRAQEEARRAAEPLQPAPQAMMPLHQGTAPLRPRGGLQQTVRTTSPGQPVFAGAAARTEPPPPLTGAAAPDHGAGPSSPNPHSTRRNTLTPSGTVLPGPARPIDTLPPGHADAGFRESERPPFQRGTLTPRKIAALAVAGAFVGICVAVLAGRGPTPDEPPGAATQAVAATSDTPPSATTSNDPPPPSTATATTTVTASTGAATAPPSASASAHPPAVKPTASATVKGPIRKGIPGRPKYSQD